MNVKNIIILIVIFFASAFVFNFQNSGKNKSTLLENPKLEKITFAGGCFWCIESVFQETDGIIDAVSGYMGGESKLANYVNVASGQTRHREVVQITYDPIVLGHSDLLNIYWSAIDPTDPGGQFADRGYQYTTAIYYHDDGQKKSAERSKQQLVESGLFESEIITDILPATDFYIAEEYHQDYYKKSSSHYKAYEEGSGRKSFVEDTWAKDAVLEFFKKTKQVQTVTPRGDYNYTDEEIEILLENLDPLAYHVVAENGTEKPFDNLYWNNKADGIYVDVVTGEALFSSTHKYDSGTGWPAFYRSIDEENLELREDNSIGITRFEVRSETGHLGHVFNDGPIEKGGRRFCINSASLLFIPLDEMQEKGYEQYLKLFKEI